MKYCIFIVCLFGTMQTFFAPPIPFYSKIKPVQNIHELESLFGKVGDTVEAKGFYNAGDGGGGVFFFVHNEMLSDSLTKIYFPAPNGKWVRVVKNQDDINIKWFGARGDSLSNDSSFIQNAIEFASRNKKAVFFPNGIYLLANIILYQGSVIKGEDKNKTKVVLLSKKVSTASCFILKGNSSNINIKNISFDAFAINSDKKNFFCIYSDLKPSDTIKNISVESCNFYNSKNYGALFLLGNYKCIRNVSVTNCLFSHVGGSAVCIRGIDGFIFTDNIVENWNQAPPTEKENEELFLKYHWKANEFPAVAIQSVPCFHLMFERNRFNNNNAVHFAIECAGTYTFNSIFRNNIFNGNGYDASGISGFFQNCLFSNNRHLHGGGSHRSGYEIVGKNDTIIHNYIEGGQISLGTGSISDYPSFGSDFIVMYDTVIGSSKPNNPVLQLGGMDTLRNCLIANNFFDNRSGIGNAPVLDLGGRGVSENISITSNKFYANDICVRMFVRDHEGLCKNIQFLQNEFIGNRIFYVDHPDKWENVLIRNNYFTISSPTGMVINTITAANHTILLDHNSIK